ncbi:16S rRNA methyltransferase [Altererythrobacter sp. B11]|uniref:16S rRNA (guanine(527)-N(7))-methyltransferase RsmG n=1 Tax=Altererythrobacter sp. B11 TaxID=2060312 RepID=UPI000DC72AEC|nr:16S rRNA (guanine(527)-N(7))-methyltransferase RsmG [Altererythrobacter sp. B11]BBC71448.1 16S rRNA methyltransferase [Altererythrobacter sp. B11]
MICDEQEAMELCRRVGSDGSLGRLAIFAELLKEENERQNLVSTASLAVVWQRHLADSAQLLLHAPAGLLGPWLDLGTGAGLPGLVIAALRPELPVLLVESRRRRVEWLSRAAAELALVNCRVLGARLEDVESTPAAIISARAFAPLGKLLGLSARFSTRETVWLLPKGRKAAQELQEQPVAIREMFHVEQSCTDPEAGILVGKGTPKLP